MSQHNAIATSQNLKELENCTSLHELPKLLTKIHFELCSTVPLADLEAQIFSKTCPKTREYFEALREQLLNLQDVASMIEDAISLLTSLDAVAKYILQITQDNANVEPRLIESFPVTALFVIKSCNKFCSDLGVSPRAEFYVPSAKTLHSTAASFSHQVVEIYERLIATNDLTHLESFVSDSFEQFRDVLQVLRSVDVKNFTKFTKLVIKFILHQRAICIQLDEISKLLTVFFDNVTSSLENACRSADLTVASPKDDKLFMTELRLCSFMMRASTQLIEELHSSLTRDAIHSIVDFIIKINTMTPPATQVNSESDLPSSYNDEIEKTTTSHLHGIIKLLLHDELFQRRLLNAADIRRNSSLDTFAVLGLLLVVVQYLAELKKDDLFDYWLDPVSDVSANLLEAIFVCFENLHVEILLPVCQPGPMYGGQPQRRMSVYEIVCLRVNHLLSFVPARLFAVLEPSLLRPVLAGLPLPASLASDVLCFVSRFGPADLSWSHLRFLVQVFLQASTRLDSDASNSLDVRHPGFCCVRRLITRLFSYLSDHDRKDMLKRFPIDRHPSLWCLVSLKTAPEAASQLFSTLTAAWNKFENDLDKFVFTLHSCSIMMFRLQASELSDYERMINKLVETVFGLMEVEKDVPEGLASECLLFLTNAFNATRNVPFAFVREMIGERDLVNILNWCIERRSKKEDLDFDYKSSCFLLSMSTHSFGPDQTEDFCKAFLNLAAMLAKGSNPFVVLNTLRALEKRSSFGTDNHLIAAFLMGDTTLYGIAYPFFSKKAKLNLLQTLISENEFITTQLQASEKKVRLNRTKVELLDEKPAQVETDEKPAIKEETTSTKPECKEEKEEPKDGNPMDFDLLSDDDDEIFSQAMSASEGTGSKQNSQEQPSGMNKTDECPTSQTKTMEGMSNEVSEDAKCVEILIKDALNEVKENIKMLGSYCKNLKSLTSDEKLPHSVIEDISSCANDLYSFC